MKIFFNSFNMHEVIDLRVSDKENIIILNGEKINENVNKVITNILQYTLGWNGEYYAPGFDGEEFVLKMDLDGEIKVVKGARILPPRYGELKEFIKELGKCKN